MQSPTPAVPTDTSSNADNTDAMAQMVVDLMKKGMSKEMAMKKAAQMMIGDNLKATMSGPEEESAEGTPGVTDSPAEDAAEDPSMQPDAMAMAQQGTPKPGSPEDIARQKMLAEMIAMGMK